MIRIPKEFSPSEYQVFSQISLTAGQVFLGVAYATFFLPPFNSVKTFAIIVSSVLTIVSWILAWQFARQSKGDDL